MPSTWSAGDFQTAAQRLGCLTRALTYQGVHPVALANVIYIDDGSVPPEIGEGWMLSGVGSEARVFSVESDARRASACQELFADRSNVVVENADWTQLLDHGPFDLLVLDGGGSGKVDEPVDVEVALKVGGTIVIDDFTPFTTWPPMPHGLPDSARLFWLEHPLLRSTEVRLAEDLSTIVGIRVV